MTDLATAIHFYQSALTRRNERGFDTMPRPPVEADGTIAYNCRCFLVPIINDGSRALPGPQFGIVPDGRKPYDLSPLEPSPAPLETGSKSDIDEIVAAGGREVFRGVSNQKLARRMAQGKDYIGEGDYGTGRYFGNRYTAGNYAEEAGGVIRAVIKPGARTVLVRDLDRMMQADEKAGKIPLMTSYGVYARERGYDVITTDRDYVNVVNPAVLVVQRRLVPNR